jgi:photosystem II stability/assembly factor-like uncharacterized protein
VGGLPTGTINGFAVHPPNAHVMLVAMRDGILRSDNGGSAWAATRGAPKNVAAVTFNPGRPSEAYAVAIDGQISVSRDGGQTWAPVR